jgi:hypothetical protein
MLPKPCDGSTNLQMLEHRLATQDGDPKELMHRMNPFANQKANEPSSESDTARFGIRRRTVQYVRYR